MRDDTDELDSIAPRHVPTGDACTWIGIGDVMTKILDNLIHQIVSELEKPEDDAAKSSSDIPLVGAPA